LTGTYQKCDFLAAEVLPQLVKDRTMYGGMYHALTISMIIR